MGPALHMNGAGGVDRGNAPGVESVTG
jgi:hypothetical protein